MRIYDAGNSLRDMQGYTFFFRAHYNAHIKAALKRKAA